MSLHPDIIIIDDRSYPISELTEYGFVAPVELPEGTTRGQGVLVLGSERLEVDFRVRGSVENEFRCSFANFPIASEEKVKAYLAKRSRVSSGNEELEARTYDELASGVVSSQSANSDAAAQSSGQKNYVKSFAFMALLFTMLGLAVLAAFFMKSRSSLSVGNSSLVGNFIPINANVEGELAEILVSEGDAVRKGDVLIRLKNAELLAVSHQLNAELATAVSKVTALERQREAFAGKLKFASKKLKLDLEVAKSEMEAADKARDSAKSAFDRLKPYVQSGAITQLEIEEFENRMLAAESICTAKHNLVRQIEFSQEAASSNVLILGDRVDDELGRISAELEVAQAEVRELEVLSQLAENRQKELEIVAPRDGRVYVTYRQVGEYIKIADELVALSYPGRSWAAGQVISSQASRIRPGQPVSIRVPSLDVRIDGTVMAVGHRAMYSKGHYNAEFRSAAATDVPVKVFIGDLPKDVPSGIRLNMVISTGFGLKWLDDAMGYELNMIGEDYASKNRPPVHEESKKSEVAFASVEKPTSLNNHRPSLSTATD